MKMKMSKHLALFLITSMTTTQTFAACQMKAQKFMELRVVSCQQAAPLVMRSIENQDYTEGEASQVQALAERISLIHAVPVSDVQLIDWNANGSLRRFRGKVERLDEENEVQYFAPSGFGSCEGYLPGTTSLYSVDENACCRDSIVIIDGRRMKDMTPRCIVDLPLITKVSESLEELPDIGFDLPAAVN